MNDLISMDKQYKTRDGREAEVLRIDMNHKHFTVAAIITNSDGTQWLASRTSTGLTFLGREHVGDFVEVKPRVKREAWMNIYPEITSTYMTRVEADCFSHKDKRLACIKVEIDCEHGEGL